MNTLLDSVGVSRYGCLDIVYLCLLMHCTALLDLTVVWSSCCEAQHDQIVVVAAAAFVVLVVVVVVVVVVLTATLEAIVLARAVDYYITWSPNLRLSVSKSIFSLNVCTNNTFSCSNHTAESRRCVSRDVSFGNHWSEDVKTQRYKLQWMFWH